MILDFGCKNPHCTPDFVCLAEQGLKYRTFEYKIFMLKTQQDKHNLGCQKVARALGQSSIGYDWERAVKVS